MRPEAALMRILGYEIGVAAPNDPKVKSQLKQKAQDLIKGKLNDPWKGLLGSHSPRADMASGGGDGYRKSLSFPRGCHQ